MYYWYGLVLSLQRDDGFGPITHQERRQHWPASTIPIPKRHVFWKVLLILGISLTHTKVIPKLVKCSPWVKTVISWRSTEQTLVAISSNNAEIISLHEVIRECIRIGSIVTHVRTIVVWSLPQMSLQAEPALRAAAWGSRLRPPISEGLGEI